MTDFPSQKQDKFVLRLPDGLRDRIKNAADINGRSMNAEIVQLLEDAYPSPTEAVGIVLDAIGKHVAEGGDLADIPESLINALRNLTDAADERLKKDG